MALGGLSFVRVLVVNAGSSSLKLSLVDGEELSHSESLTAADGSADTDELTDVIERWAPIDAVGHRIVHGGVHHDAAVVVDDSVRAELEELGTMAPLHQPRGLAALDAVRACLPRTVSVACFDTAFHRSIPAEASTYAVPGAWRERYGIRRFGFHGLSHAYVARRAGELLGGRPPRLVSCHLGSGASLCAIAEGRSVDTTMGFTPLEGLVMATRSGSVDPGAILWLELHADVPPETVEDALEHRSGLLGLTGSADLREVLERARGGDADAQLGRDVYVRRIVSSVAEMAVALGGIDALAFTGGAGEHSAELRSLVSGRLGLFGIELDEGANLSIEGDGTISSGDSAAAVLVIAAHEDLEIAREVHALLSS